MQTGQNNIIIDFGAVDTYQSNVLGLKINDCLYHITYIVQNIVFYMYI